MTAFDTIVVGLKSCYNRIRIKSTVIHSEFRRGVPKMAKLFKQSKANAKPLQAKGIPNIWIKTNQALIAALTLVSLLTQNWWLLTLVFFVQVIAYRFGIQYNLFIRLTKVFWQNRLDVNDVQAYELARFNQTLAVIMLFAASISGAAGFPIGAYIFGGMVTAAATAAVLGYCIGCTIYFQYKQFKARRSS
jgi:hypothetical protein